MMPNDINSEKTIIGSILFDAESCFDAFEKLKPEHFHTKALAETYRVMFELYKDDKPINIISVEEELKKSGLNLGSSLMNISAGIFTAVHCPSAVEIVLDKFIRRKIITGASEVLKMVSNDEVRTEKVLELYEREAFNLGEEKYSQGLEHVSQIVTRTLDGFQKIMEGQEFGVPCGFRDIDRIIHGFRKKTLNIVAARPAMGKSAFALAVAKRSGVNTAFFSIEMDSEEMVERMVSSSSGIDSGRLRDRSELKRKTPDIVEACAEIRTQKIWIDGSPSKTPLQLVSQCKRLKAKEGLGLVIVDYLQFMELEGKSESKRIEVSNISKQLKQAAKILDVPIIALAQLNRDCESRPDKRPILADLRESGTIEQDAHMVWVLYRDEVYNNDSPDKGVAEIIVRKNRSGPIGMFKLFFEKETTTFSDYSKAPEPVGGWS